ncbi:MAG: hypothetical protein AAFY26_15550 [Cyanobacteria bacterium J06638_22]
MKHVLVNGTLIWEALQEDAESDFDALWKVLQSSTVQGYITQDDLDSLYYRIATERGVELAFVVVSHVQQVLTVYSPTLHRGVDVAIAPDHRAGRDLAQPLVDLPVSGMPLVSVPEFLERHTLNQLFERSAPQTYVKSWQRKGLQSDFDPLLLVPLALTLLLQNTPLGQSLITTLMSWFGSQPEDEANLNPSLGTAQGTRSFPMRSHNPNPAGDGSDVHPVSLDPESLDYQGDGLEADASGGGDRPSAFPNAILPGGLNPSSDWSSVRQLHHSILHFNGAVAETTSAPAANSLIATSRDRILPTTGAGGRPVTTQQRGSTVSTTNESPRGDRTQLSSSVVIVLRGQPAGDRPQRLPIPGPSPVPSPPNPSVPEPPPLEPLRTVSVPNTTPDPNAIDVTDPSSMGERTPFLSQPPPQNGNPNQNLELEHAEGMGGSAVEPDGAVMVLTAESSSSEEPTSNPPMAEIDVLIAIALPFDIEMTTPDAGNPSSNSFILADALIWVQSQTIQGQSNQNDDLIQVPLLTGNEYLRNDISSDFTGSVDAVHPHSQWSLTGNEYGGNDYGLLLDELHENTPDAFDELLQGGYRQLEQQQNDFVQMNALQQIFPLESSLNLEQDYQILRVTVNELTFSDRIEIGVTLTVTDSQMHQLSSSTTTPLLEPVPLLN